MATSYLHRWNSSTSSTRPLSLSSDRIINSSNSRCFTYKPPSSSKSHPVRLHSVEGISVQSDFRSVHLIQQASLGIQRYVPKLADEGDGGTYYLFDLSGRTLGVFKPTDEDPQGANNPKKKKDKRDVMHADKVTSLLRTSIPPGTTAIREVAAYCIDRGFAGVPPTVLTRVIGWQFCPSQSISNTDNQYIPPIGGTVKPDRRDVSMLSKHDDQQATSQKTTIGSLQTYVVHECSSWDLAPHMYSVEDVHRIGILDIRLFNTDRHGGNILVSKKRQRKQQTPQSLHRSAGGAADEACFSLVPIDHGFTFPTSLCEANFEWLFWPQTRKPFSEQTLEYIELIDVKKDAALLKDLGLEPIAIVVNRIATMFLKIGARHGLTLFEIAYRCCREDPDLPCALESLCSKVEMLVRMNNGGGSCCGSIEPRLSNGIPETIDDDSEYWDLLERCMLEEVCGIVYRNECKCQRKCSQRK